MGIRELIGHLVGDLSVVILVASGIWLARYIQTRRPIRPGDGVYDNPADGEAEEE